ncbi:MAG: HAD-IC family P-type ATPase, partial [Gemmatimonadota bacterium]
VLTGDNERVAASIAGALGIEYQARLLPPDKIEVVRKLQADGAIVMMVGDGINDAPALTQADVGVAMGAAGTAAAVESADVALLRDDLDLLPEAIVLGRRAARTIRQNLGFAAAYNAIGVSLAAFGILPPVWAAAAQLLPDVGVMLNSSRLLGPLRQDPHGASAATANGATSVAPGKPAQLPLVRASQSPSHSPTTRGEKKTDQDWAASTSRMRASSDRYFDSPIRRLTQTSVIERASAARFRNSV